jgi:hypothetical protein
MKTPSPLITAVATLVAGCALVAPSLATAKAPPTYKVSIKGNQVSTWNQVHVPTFTCDASVTGAGSQDVPIITEKPLKLQLVRPKGMPAFLAETGDPNAQFGIASPIRIDTLVEREGYQNIQAPGGECNGTGGWDGERPAADCGHRSGTIELNLGYGSYLGDPALDAATKDIFKVSGHYGNFYEVPPLVPDALGGDPIGHTFDNCPYWPAGSASALDELIFTGEKLPVSKLARMKPGKSVKLSGGEVEPESSEDFSGETVVAWNLTMKRVR